MKTRIILFLLLTLSIKSYTQKKDTLPRKDDKEDNQMIVYDFAKGIYETSTIKPKYGRPIIFKIKNINRFFYAPVIEGITGEITDETIGIKPPAPSENANQKAPENTDDKIEKKDNRKIENIKLTITGLSSNIDSSLIKNNEDLSFSEERPKTVNELYDAYKRKISTLSKRIQTYVYIINKLNSNYNNYLDKVNTPDLTFEGYKKLFEDSNNNNHTFLEKSEILNVDKFQNKYVILNEYQEIKIEFLDFLDSNELENIINIFKESNNGEVSKNIKNNAEKWRAYINKTDEEINKMNLHKKLNFVEIVNRILSNPSSYEYVSNPIQAFGDYLDFNIDIKEKKIVNDEYTIFNSNRKFSYKEFINGGVRLDFGIGISIDFGKKMNSTLLLKTVLEKNF